MIFNHYFIKEITFAKIAFVNSHTQTIWPVEGWEIYAWYIGEQYIEVVYLVI